jgi:hypothetical protein
MSTRSQLPLTPELLAKAAEKVGIDPQLVPQIWNELDASAPRPKFNVSNVAFYFGAMIIISAMTWFLTSAWDSTGGLFKLGTALVYAAAFAVAGFWLRERPGMRVPSGLLVTAAVCMTPLAVFGLESATHFWAQGDPGKYSGFYEWIKGSWVPLEVATIVVGLVTIRFERFPFLVAPIAFASWYLSMDLAAYAIHSTDWQAEWDGRSIVSMIVGLVTIVAALFIDRFTREDYAFWLYFFGSMSFWGGLWARGESSGEPAQFAALVIGLAFVAASIILGRRVLAVFGCLECFSYLGHLAWDFRDSLSFPVVLTVVGLGVIALGVWYQKNLPRIEAAAGALVPEGVRKFIPRSRVA